MKNSEHRRYSLGGFARIRRSSPVWATPAIVIQDEKYAGNLPTVLVVPLTSTQKALRFAGTTAIVATAESGLRTDSVALVFQCLAIDRNQVGERMGQASESEKANVLAELAKLTGQSE